MKERINIFVFEHRKRITWLVRIMVMLISVLTFASMIYYHGFEHPGGPPAWVDWVIRSFYGVVVVNFLLRFFFTLNRRQFLAQNPIESVLIAFILYNGISHYILGIPLLERFLHLIGAAGFEGFYSFLLQLFLLLIVGINFVKELKNIGKLHLKPSTLFVGSFLLLIGMGTVMLMLPAVNTTPGGMNFIDALFTATSAGCVTGLIVEDTATYFNIKGQLVILALMQIGGIGILSFASFFATFIKKSVGVSYQTMLQNLTDAEHPMGAVNLLRPIVFLTFGIEAVVAFCLYFLWGEVPFDSVAQKIYFSIFHAVSAFNNAGFSLFTNGLYEQGVRDLYLLHLTVALTIFLGSLGFPAIRDIFFLENVRKRMEQPWRKWKLSTRIAFYSSLALILAGAVGFFLLEQNGSLKGKNLSEAVIASLFQSVTTRTAGFNTVDMASLSVPVLFLMMFLMFIGASSGSTGGGIKTSTFVVIFVALIGIIRGKKSFSLGRRNIQKDTLLKAFSIFIFGATYVFAGILILTMLEPDLPITSLVFENISAFATVGLSTGITAELGTGAKILMVCNMFVGRIGLLTLALSLSTPERYGHKYIYPDTHIMVG